MCDRCKGEQWVCEAHLDKPWRDADGCTCAPGVPCPDCNAGDEPSDPPGFEVIVDASGDKRN